MKHKHEWDDNKYPRCLICGKPKHKVIVDKEATKEYKHRYYLDNVKKRVKA